VNGDILPDVLEPGLHVVFCGTQAGSASARRGAYYAGPGNKFWPVLHEIGLVPVTLGAAEVEGLMARFGHGGELPVDPETQTISWPAGEVVPFEMDQFIRQALLEGMDAITRTLRHEAAIVAFEARLPSAVQTTSL